MKLREVMLLVLAVLLGLLADPGMRSEPTVRDEACR